MKYRPSKSFLRIVIPLVVLTAALGFGLLPEVKEFEARPIPGEIAFRSAKLQTSKIATISASSAAPFKLPTEWFEEGWENVMTWEHNPWKVKRRGAGDHYFTLSGSKDPADQARAKELQRLAQAWYERLLLRYPEMAVAIKSIPDNQNGFLKWLEFKERFEKPNRYYPAIAFPKELDQYLKNDGPWNAEAAKSWLSQQKPLLDEIRAIGLMPDASVNGIAVERWSFTPARFAQSCIQSLTLEARLAAEQGDAATAMESIRAAKGLADHFSQVETPTLLGVTVQILIQRQLEKVVLSEIIPSLAGGHIEPAAWESLLNPTVSPPSEFARILKGEWSNSSRQYLLPILLDSDDPNPITDGGDLLDAFSSPFGETIRNHEGATITDLPTLLVNETTDLSHLSRQARQWAEILFVGSKTWRKGWDHAQSGTALTKAAFAIMKNQPIPKDPVYGQDYRWDPATRQLSMPAGKTFDDLGIKPITVPKL